MGIFCGTIGLYCTNTKTGILLLDVFFRGLILNHISEICWTLKIGTSNTYLLLIPMKYLVYNYEKFSFGTTIKIILRYILKSCNKIAIHI